MYRILLIIILFVMCKNKEKKIDELKKEVSRLQDLGNCNIDKVEKKQEVAETNQKYGVTQTQYIQECDIEATCQKTKEKQEQEARENKITAILVTGAGLIIISAIVFLMTSWNTVNDPIKTLVLMLLVGVFLGASKIAKNKFGLEKASNTFFYMAMAYIPICLISISILGLFGEFLSIGGDGRYIYLSISSLLIAFMYSIVNSTRVDKYLQSASIVFQMFAVMFGSCLIRPDIYAIIIGLLLYVLVIQVINANKQDYKIGSVICRVLVYTASIITIFSVFSDITVMPIILILVLLNSLALAIESKSIGDVLLFNIFLNLTGVYCIVNYVTVQYLQQILMLINIMLIFAWQYAIFNNSKKSTFKDIYPIVSFGALQLLFMHNIAAVSATQNMFALRSYVVSFMQIVVLLASYKKANINMKRIISKLLPLFVIITGISICVSHALSYHAYILLAFIVFGIGEIQLNKIIRNVFFKYSHILVVAIFMLIAMLDYNSIKNDCIYFMLLSMMYVYSFVKTKNGVHKYLSYLSINFVMTSILYLFKLPSEMFLVIPAIVAGGIMCVENRLPILKDSFSEIWIIIYQIISLITLSLLPHNINLVALIIFALLTIFENRKNKKLDLYDTIPVIGLLFGIHNSNISNTVEILMLSISTMVITGVSLIPRKINTYTVFSIVHLLSLISSVGDPIVGRIIAIMWSISNACIIKSGKGKDLFKVISSFIIFSLYIFVIHNSNIVVDKVLTLIGYIILAIYILRNILEKYLKSIDTLEVGVFSIIYLIAMSIATNAVEGLIVLAVMVGMIFYTYIKRYGALFCTTIIAIIVNTLYMTRNFWASISWWVYLLVLGVLLISFAIKNEMGQKKDSKKLLDIIKSIKDNIDN